MISEGNEETKRTGLSSFICLRKNAFPMDLARFPSARSHVHKGPRLSFVGTRATDTLFASACYVRLINRHNCVLIIIEVPRLRMAKGRLAGLNFLFLVARVKEFYAFATTNLRNFVKLNGSQFEELPAEEFDCTCITRVLSCRRFLPQ